MKNTRLEYICMFLYAKDLPTIDPSFLITIMKKNEELIVKDWNIYALAFWNVSENVFFKPAIFCKWFILRCVLGNF